MWCDHVPATGGVLIPLVRWRVIPPPSQASVVALAEALKLPLPLASILVQRDLQEVEAARTFLRPALDALSDPFTLAGMSQAVARITKAVKHGETILIYGDYDVDGQCSTTILVRTLRQAGARVHYSVPDRLTDGYGFQQPGIDRATQLGATLVITCDCGITSVKEVDTAAALGIDTVITDHHRPGPVLPAAVAVVNPNRSDDNSGLGDLCGAGVAFKLVQALTSTLDLPDHFPMHLLDYVAVATVADVVALRGENRILVRHGLKLLAETRWEGLAALLRVTGIQGPQVQAAQVGFILAPRLNAAGRVAHAENSIALLLSDDPQQAHALALGLEEYNRQRQQLDRQIQETALAQVAAEFSDPEQHPAIVLAGEGWHSGVIGIVASRVVERYGRPTFLIAIDQDGVGKGSGRSIPGFDLHAALEQCADLLDRYGGHPMAAGLTIREELIDAFRERLTAVASSRLKPADLGPSLRVDLEVTLEEVTADLERFARHLEPCGSANHAPIYGVRDVRLEGIRRVSTSHLKTTLAQGEHRIEGIAFGWANRVPWLDQQQGPKQADVAFRLELNHWNKGKSLQAMIVALSPPGKA